MPASEHSLHLTDAYRAQLLRVRARITAAISDAWSLVALDELDVSFRRWLRVADTQLAFGQTEAVRLTGSYLGAFLTSETGEAADVQPLEVEKYAGVASDGRSTRILLASAVIGVKLALLHRRNEVEALAAGQARAVRAARMEVMQAARASLQDGIAADDRVVGWRRVGSGRPCGACLGSLSGEVSSKKRPPRVHPACRCTAEPVVTGITETATRPTGEQLFRRMSKDDQDALFAGRGGERKAELIRSGRVGLTELVTTDRRPDAGVWITETPLAELLKT